MNRVFIVGAGYVGSATAELLRGAGHEVHTGRRTQGAGPNVHAMDVLVPATYPPALSQADCIVYCVSADSSSDADYRAAYVEGLRQVLAAAQRGRVRRLVFVSSTSVYAQDDGSWVDERSPTMPQSTSARLLLEAEGLLTQAALETTTVRFSGIYGPGRDRVVQLARTRAPVSAHARETFTNRIHRDDCARVLAHLLARPVVAPIYVGSDEAPTRLGEILDWLAERLGVEPPPIGPDSELVPQRGGNKRLSPAQLHNEAFAFAYPTYREGMTALLGSVEGRKS